MVIEELPERLRVCAQMVGSGNKLSRLTGISRRTIETWFTGTVEPRLSSLEKIAEAADVNLAWLAAGVEPKSGEGTEELKVAKNEQVALRQETATKKYKTANSINLEELSERLRECSKKAGSGNELSRITGIPRNTIESWINGNVEPRLSSLGKIADKTDIALYWLVTGEGPRDANEADRSDYIKKEQVELHQEALTIIIDTYDRLISDSAFEGVDTSALKARLCVQTYLTALTRMHEDGDYEIDPVKFRGAIEDSFKIIMEMREFR